MSDLTYFDNQPERTPEYLAQVLRLAEDIRAAQVVANATGTLARMSSVWGHLDKALVAALDEYLCPEGTDCTALVDQVREQIHDNGENVTHNLRHLYLHHEQRGIYFTGTLVFADGSGERDGWVDPIWSPTTVQVRREEVTPLVCAPDDEDPARWLANTVRHWMTIDSWEESGIYAAESRTDEDGHDVRLVAHPFGFDTETIERARALTEQ